MVMNQIKEQNTNQKPVSDKKKLLCLILLWVGCAVVGGGVGFLIATAQKGNGWDPAAFLTRMAPTLSVIVLILLVIVNFGPAVWYFLKLRVFNRRVHAVKPDDYEELDALDAYMDAPMKVSSYIMPISSALFAIQFHLTVLTDSTFAAADFVFIASVVVFLASLFLPFILQKKTVDLIKVLNPEKKGSVLDLNFRSKWENSCDEAELQIIRKGGACAFKAGSTACIVLWVISTLTMMLLETNALAPVCVCLIWLIMQIAYFKGCK